MKSTPLGVQNEIQDALTSYQDKSSAVKAAHAATRKAIQEDTRRTAIAKKEDLDALRQQTKGKLDALKNDQLAFEKGLRDRVERELRGSQPADANSILLRRDASDRARKLDRSEALEVLRDAIRNGDPEMSHAVGTRARNLGWVDVAEEWMAEYPTSANSAEALAVIDDNLSSGAHNLLTSVMYSAPE